MYAGYVINPCEPIVIRAIFRVIRRIAFRLPIISQCTNPRRGFFQLFFLLFFFFSSLIPTFHQSVMEFLSRFEFETQREREREKMGGIVSFKDRSPIFSILFRFLLSLFSFFMKFSIGKFPFRTFSCDSPRGRFYFFSHVLVSSLKMTR